MIDSYNFSFLQEVFVWSFQLVSVMFFFFFPFIIFWTYNLYFRREDSLIVIIIHMDRTV